MKQRGRFWLGTERTSTCLPCLALVGSHCVTASLYIKGYYSCFSHKETTTQRVSAPALVLLRRDQGRFKSRPVWSFPYVFLPPGPVTWVVLSCPGSFCVLVTLHHQRHWDRLYNPRNSCTGVQACSRSPLRLANIRPRFQFKPRNKWTGHSLRAPWCPPPPAPINRSVLPGAVE